LKKIHKNLNVFSGILIFDGATDRSWRVVHSSMFPNPDHGMYKVSTRVLCLKTRKI